MPQQNKGKARAWDAMDATADQPFISRITASASHLTAALCSGPPSPAALSSWNSNEKGGSSATRHVAPEIAEASKNPPPHPPSPLGSVAGPQSSTLEKALDTSEHMAQREARFAAFLDSSTPVLVPVVLDTSEPTWQATPSSHGTLTMQMPVASPCALREQEDRDGQAVVALLSAHDEEAPIFAPAQESTPENTGNLRSNLFAAHSSARVVASDLGDDLLNFVPAYLQGPQSGRYTASDTPTTSARAEEAFSHLGTADMGQGWQIWLRQWSCVLARYEDEVWSDLASLVKDARAEVQQWADIKVDGKPKVPTALLRLRHVLGHIQGL